MLACRCIRGHSDRRPSDKTTCWLGGVGTAKNTTKHRDTSVWGPPWNHAHMKFLFTRCQAATSKRKEENQARLGRFVRSKHVSRTASKDRHVKHNAKQSSMASFQVGVRAHGSFSPVLLAPSRFKEQVGGLNSRRYPLGSMAPKLGQEFVRSLRADGMSEPAIREQLKTMGYKTGRISQLLAATAATVAVATFLQPWTQRPETCAGSGICMCTHL